jgi:hypothetical protein
VSLLDALRTPADVYDPDLFDAEILTDRISTNVEFTFDDICMVLGLSAKSVWRKIRQGQCPPPDHRIPCKGGSRAIWTRRQIVGIFLERIQHPPDRPSCGTRRGYDVHLRNGEETCRACRNAENARRNPHVVRGVA